MVLLVSQSDYLYHVQLVFSLAQTQTYVRIGKDRKGLSNYNTPMIGVSLRDCQNHH